MYGGHESAFQRPRRPMKENTVHREEGLKELSTVVKAPFWTWLFTLGLVQIESAVLLRVSPPHPVFPGEHYKAAHISGYGLDISL